MAGSVYNAGFRAGHMAGGSLGWLHCFQQSQSPERKVLVGEAAILGEAATALENELHPRYWPAPKNRSLPAWQQGWREGFVKGYIGHVTRFGLAPMQHRCTVCGYTGEDVHPYQVVRVGLSQKWYECDDLVRCQSLLLETRQSRRRLFSEWMTA